jgi:CheY-like chemotaxis protein
MTPLNCIALIDDNPADNYLHERAIRKAGAALHVEVYEEAEVALECLRDGTSQPDLILLDLNMPGMDGWEFLEAFHQLPEERRQAPVMVMLTTSVNPADEERARANGILRGFCAKPLTQEACLELIQSMF